MVAAAATPDPRARHSWPERDLALLAVLVGAAPRVEEVVDLTVGSLEATDRSPLRVRGKGGKTD